MSDDRPASGVDEEKVREAAWRAFPAPVPHAPLGLYADRVRDTVTKREAFADGAVYGYREGFAAGRAPLSELVDAAIAVRQDVRSNANTYCWARMREPAEDTEQRLAALDAALAALGVGLQVLSEKAADLPPAWEEARDGE